jgi:glycosyltransferase involved in cell wall biosynthesis
MNGAVKEYVTFVAAHTWDVIVMHCAQIWTTDAMLPHLSALPAAKVFVFHGISAFGDPAYQQYFVSLADILRKLDAVVSLSGLVEDTRFCERFGLRQPTVIPNGADLKRWKEKHQEIRRRWQIGDRPWLVTVSNHNPLKGHNQFIQLARDIRSEIPQLAATIIGGNYPAAKYNLGSLGIKGGCWYRCRVQSALQRVVDLRPGAARSDVIAAVQEADILICTSSWEASPLSIIESMAAGTPWISMDVGCVRENAGGIVVRSADEMRSAVLRLLQDGAVRHVLGSEGRARAAAKHDWNSVVSQHQDLYRNICHTTVS